MVKHFGLPYQGSKDRIALDLHRQLPSGERFVDLFGGGFAMSHSALLIKGKYKKVLQNELNPLLVDLVKRAISGEFNYESFNPEFITRDKFAELKDRDGYVKYIWSFGNNGRQYLFGKDVEPIKHAGHDYVVFGKPIPGMNLPVKGTILQRRMVLRQAGAKLAADMIRKNPSLKKDKRQIESKYELQQLQQLERLQRLERLQQLELICGDYKDYHYRDGDIVYCDPPYEKTTGYDKGFDTKGFYDWVASRPYQVWFSSYKISDKRFKMVWAKQLRGLAAGAKDIYNFECLYTNR